MHTGNYTGRNDSWVNSLDKYLMRQEIEYVARHGGDFVSFLEPYKHDPVQMEAFLKRIGFYFLERIYEHGIWFRTKDNVRISHDGYVIFLESADDKRKREINYI